MHLLPYRLRRLLHRPKRARRSTPESVTVHDQREHDLRRYRPRPRASPAAEVEMDSDEKLDQSAAAPGLDG